MKAKSETSFMLVKTEKPMQIKVKMEAKKDKKTKKGFKTFSVKSKRLLIPPKIIIHNIKQH